MMEITDEDSGASKPVVMGREMGNRRALRDIKNLVGVPPPYPCAVAKRGLSEKNVVGAKNQENQVVGAQRPMTRKFAASLAKSQPCHEEVTDKKYGAAIDNEKQKKPVTLTMPIDSDLDQLVNESMLPMMEISDEMEDCEVIKEVIMEDAVDIDSCDANNPLAVVDYVEDIYKYYRRVESTGCVSPDYMSNQFDINDKMRAILIDWLIEVHYKFELMDETLYLTVNIIDRYLAKQTVVRKKLQLVGVTAMLLACKYEEVSVPVVQDLILISDQAYTRDEILDMERLIVNTLQFNMSVPTPYVFMRRFLKAADSDKKLELLSFFIIELCLVEYQMLKFQPSLLAAAAIYTAQCSLKGSKCWTKTSEVYTTYNEDQLLECSRMMVDFHQKAGVGRLTGVHRKYCTFKFGCAAKSEPAVFLLDTRF